MLVAGEAAQDRAERLALRVHWQGWYVGQLGGPRGSFNSRVLDFVPSGATSSIIVFYGCIGIQTDVIQAK